MTNVYSFYTRRPIEVHVTSGSFCERVLERVRKDSYGKPVYCFERQRVIRVTQTEGDYHD